MKKAAGLAGRIAAFAGVTLLLCLVALYGVMWVLVNGPSPTARRLFVLSVRETSAVGFLANLYLSQEEIDEIVGTSAKTDISDGGNLSGESAETIDASLISIPSDTSDMPDAAVESAPTETQSETPASDKAPKETAKAEEAVEADGGGIEIIDISGSTYKGKLMIVTDCSRVFVGVPDSYGEDSSGLTLKQMIAKYGASAGINAGGFYDPGGSGTGGIPEGIVISGGEILWGDEYSTYNLIGFDKNGLLYVGKMTGRAALDCGVTEAVSFGPALVINGVAQNEKWKLGGGINPRTAIGQRSDGALLLLVINGRQLDSLGATYDDLVDIMLSYGAVNASNLDGGSSSLMISGGEYITNSAYVLGERVIPTAILIR